jgi:hypothetical protein
MNLEHEHRRRPGVLATLAAAVAVLLAGCGGGSHANTGVAHLASGTGSSTTGGAARSSGSGSLEAEALAFAKCMRANGLPNFPDPPPGGGFEFHRGSGIDPSSPSFKAAQAKCKRFLPAGPGSGPPPSAQTLARFLNIARCMRRHGIAGFPDPRTSMPSNPHPPAGGGTFVISDIEGVILVMGSIDEHSPAFERAAAACAFPLHNH